jgi:oligoribonuclease (3'-5' exoribonuclease)
MAADEQRNLHELTRSVHVMMEDWKRIEHSTGGTAEHLTDLIYKIKFGQRSTLEYLGQAIKLENHPKLREVGNALYSDKKQLITALEELRDKQKQSNLEVAIQRNQVERWRASFDPILKMQKAALKTARKHAAVDKINIAYVENLISLKNRLNAITGKELSVEFILIKAFKSAVEYSGQINAALIAGNSDLDTRYKLTEQVLEVQVKTGVSSQHLLNSAKALTSVWPKMRSDFGSTLEVMVQMEDGLGVSVENSAQLARVFEINLKTQVRDVADRITVIANSTSLLADEATRFATEIGRGLRLLGEGGARQAKEVAGYVTMLAGRMKDAGGDAEEIVKLFKEMTTGTSQGFMLRGMAGVRQPGSLGSEAGAQQAMQGIGRMIDRIVTAAPRTAAFSAQLEAASQMLGISTDSVVLYRKMLQEANKPLDEHAKLQERWREQVTVANEAFNRLTGALHALIQRSLGPLLPIVAEGLGGLATTISFIASHGVTLAAATVLMTAAVGYTIRSFILLAYQLQITAASSLKAAAAERARSGITAATGGLGLAGAVGKLATSLSGLVARFSPYALALAIGYAIGTAINTIFPKTMASFGEHLYKIFHGTTTASLLKPGQGVSQYQFMGDVRKVMARQGIEAAGEYFKKHLYEVNNRALVRKEGVQSLLNQFNETAAQYRENIGLRSVTSAEKQTLENDRKLIEQQRQVVKNTGDSAQLMKKVESDRAQENLRKSQTQLQELIQRNVNTNLNIDWNMPTKLNLTR